MKPYINVSVLILREETNDVKCEISVEDFVRSCENRKVKYLLKIKDKIYPCPVKQHKVIEEGKFKYSLSGTKFKFKYSSFDYFIGDLSLTPRRNFILGSDEVLIKVKFRSIQNSGKNLPVLCVLEKENNVVLYFFELFKFTKGKGEIFVIFKPNLSQGEGRYGIDFYVAGNLLFNENIEFKHLTYRKIFSNAKKLT